MPRFKVRVEISVPAHVEEQEVWVQADDKKTASLRAKVQATLRYPADKEKKYPKGVKVKVFDVAEIPPPSTLESVCSNRGSHRPHLWNPEARCPGRSFDLT